MTVKERRRDNEPTTSRQPTGGASVETEPHKPDSLPFVALWQDETGVIQIKLGNITPINAVALLELGTFRYKAMLLPSISPRPVQAPEGSEPPRGSAPKN